MEDFHIFTVNDTTDSQLEEYNSEAELEIEESNLINKGVVISQEASHFSPEARFESVENSKEDAQKPNFKNMNLIEELNEVNTIVSNKTNTNFFSKENEEVNTDQRQSSNNSAKGTFAFKKHSKKPFHSTQKKRKNREKGPGSKKSRINSKKTNENEDKNTKKLGVKTRSKFIKKNK